MVMLEMSFGFGGRERWSRDASTELPVLGMEGQLPCHSPNRTAALQDPREQFSGVYDLDEWMKATLPWNMYYHTT
jgi:hypothetical protein